MLGALSVNPSGLEFMLGVLSVNAGVLAFMLVAAKVAGTQYQNSTGIAVSFHGSACSTIWRSWLDGPGWVGVSNCARLAAQFPPIIISEDKNACRRGS